MLLSTQCGASCSRIRHSELIAQLSTRGFEKGCQQRVNHALTSAPHLEHFSLAPYHGVVLMAVAYNGKPAVLAKFSTAITAKDEDAFEHHFC